jgi:excisionase family DNA binding protein
MVIPPSPEDRLRAMLRVADLPVRASYRIDEVARILRCHRCTLYEMMDEGKLRFIRLRPSMRRIDWATLVHLLAHDPAADE